MSTLLLEKDLRSSTEDNATEDSKEARTLVRARTLSALESLDPERRTAVMRFLTEADLVQSVDERAPIVGLNGADLSGADLSGAKGVTDGQLKQAKTLEGATMPNGQKYEDWLKSRREDGEDSGPW